MKRTIIKIDEDLCNGCGLCVEGCHEGALQMIEGKARMISDLYCDGLGACIPECPVGAISLEEREAEPYDEVKVMERISPKGEATVLAHLNHLIDHDQHEFVRQGVKYIKENNIEIDLGKLKKQNNKEDMKEVFAGQTALRESPANGGGCPGSRIMSFGQTGESASAEVSELRQWPVQLHLVNPQAPYFKNADVLLAADCVAFAAGDFHSSYLRGKTLAIACPKLDHSKEVYIEKLTSMINDSGINTLTVAVMEVPCCSGLLQMAKMAAEKASRKVPVKAITIGIKGDNISEEWI